MEATKQQLIDHHTDVERHGEESRFLGRPSRNQNGRLKGGGWLGRGHFEGS